MHRLALGCAILALGIMASPGAAQQADPQQVTAAAAQVPDQPQAQPLPEPPPFPPLHKAKPSHRTVDLSKDYPSASRHRSSSTHHQTTSSRHHATKPGKTASSRHSAKSTHHAVSHPTVHASPKTIRACHKMSYRQIMRSSTCGALMRQDLESADRQARKASRHKASTHHKATTHKTTTRKKTTAHHRSRH